MDTLFKVLLGNLVLNKGPQDLPYSSALMRLCLLLYFFTGLPGLLTNSEFDQAVYAQALDVLVLLTFIYLCLQAFAKLARFTQTITALAAVGAIFQLLVLPLLLNSQEVTEVSQVSLGVSLLLLMFVSWNLAVIAHIFRESFGIRLPAAMALTICYVFITLLIRKFFFPELA